MSSAAISKAIAQYPQTPPISSYDPSSLSDVWNFFKHRNSADGLDGSTVDVTA